MKSTVVALLLLAATPALARAPEGLAPDPAMKAWFNSQKIPGVLGPEGNGVSCCNDKIDARIVNYRQRNGHWEAYLTHKLWPDVISQDHWEVVPDKAILQHTSNPTGGAVAWVATAGYFFGDASYLPGQIMCFARPPEA